MPEQEERIRCRYCGSNNFAGTATCWQCNRPLLISQNQPAVRPEPQLVNAVESWPAKPVDYVSMSPIVDHSTADKAAIAMGLLFPLIGYPVGIVFMMLDDQRKTQLGRLTIFWSTIGMVLTLVGTLMFAGAIGSIAGKLIPSGGGGGGGGGGLQKLMPSDDSN